MACESTIIHVVGIALLLQVHSELPSNGSMELKLTLIPITPGLQVRFVECGNDGYALYLLHAGDWPSLVP